MDKLNELKKHIAQASELLLESAAPFDRACTIVNELKAELDKLEQEQQPKPWPQVGDRYLTVDYDGYTVLSSWGDEKFDHYRLSTGNCHRTEAEALAYREWQTDPRVVARGMIERQPGFDPRGEFDFEIDRDGDVHWGYAEPYKGWFKSTEDLIVVIQTLGAPLIKVALGVITDKEEAGRIVREAMGR